MFSKEDLETIQMIEDYKKYSSWRFFEPYPKQIEFMNLGAKFPERLLTAGNKVGKSYVGAFETACHAIGEYPPWWKGLRYDQNTGPCDIWVGGTSGTAVRDTAQKLLFGEPGIEELLGTGFIPKANIIGQPSSSRSATSAFDTAHIRHISGGISPLGFKTYEQDRRHWQGPVKKFLWFDEEPPLDIFTEGLARLAASSVGAFILTFTPLFGYSEVVKRFLEETHPRRAHVQMALSDASHMSQEMIEATLSMYPRHEWPARRDGDPHLAGGLIFQAAPADLMEDQWAIGLGQTGMQMPGHWATLWGVDFTHSGSTNSHPFAAVLLAWDRDTDTGHLLDAFKTREGLPVVHAERMKRIGANVPVAWPHDGHVTDLKGEDIVGMYRKTGLNMLADHATFSEGGYSTEAGIMDLDQAMRGSRFKVARHLTDWFGEYRLYHRNEDGKIVKENDDLMSATRIVWMARRHARAVPLGSKIRRPHRPLVGNTIDPFTGREVFGPR